MQIREGTSCFSLKWKCDWWGGGSNSPVSPTHFREGTSCFSLNGSNDWWD